MYVDALMGALYLNLTYSNLYYLFISRNDRYGSEPLLYASSCSKEVGIRGDRENR